jgi:hypothetical protein
MTPKRFAGYASPNYTMVPDELFDEQLPDLSGAELKVLLYIIRRTFGFKKDSDNISLNQLLHGITTRAGERLDRGTGLSRSTLVAALKGLAEKNLIIVEQRSSAEKGNEATNYRLNLLYHPRSKIIPGESEYRTRLVRKSNPQETARHQTDIHLRNSKGNTSEGDGEPGSPDDGGVEKLSRSLTGPGNRALSRLHQTAHRNNNGFRPVSEVIHDAHSDLIKFRRPKAPGTHPHLKPSPQIASCIADISAELGDSMHLRSNLSHVMRLFQESNIRESAFVARLFEARAIVKDQRITHARLGTGAYIHKPMPYSFSVVKDLLGLKDAQAEAESSSNLTDGPTRQGRGERWINGQPDG